MRGIIQPILDGTKLISKEVVFLEKKTTFFKISPTLIFCLILINLISLNTLFNSLFLINYFLFLIFRIGFSIYSTILRGWRSFSKYALIGSIRSCRQSISHEIVISFFILTFFFFSENTLLVTLKKAFSFLLLPRIFLFFLISLTETNRPPFDFREGERELISGFNLEFRRVYFTFLFLGEYGIIIFFSFLSSIFYLSYRTSLSIFYIYIYVLTRTRLPRFRYDKLISFIWLKILPIRCFSFLFFFLTL